MAWTAPRTWVVGEVVTAAEFNAHIRDNLLYLYNTLQLGSPPTITGSRGGNAALASLLTALATSGLIIDSTTA